MASFQFNSAEVIDTLPEALLVTSDKGELVYVNRALESLMGYPSSDLIGHHVSLLMPAGERTHLDALTWFERWAQNPDAHQLRHLHLDGLTKTSKSAHFAQISTDSSPIRRAPMARPGGLEPPTC